MTIQECYRQMGANYEDVLKRLYNEGMICRFTLMFLNDDSYPKLEQALKEGNVKEAEHNNEKTKHPQSTIKRLEAIPCLR